MINAMIADLVFFFFSSRRRHTRFDCDWSSDVCSSDLEWNLPNVILRWIVAGFESGQIEFGRFHSGAGTNAILLVTPVDRAEAEEYEEQIGRASCRERV